MSCRRRLDFIINFGKDDRLRSFGFRRILRLGAAHMNHQKCQHLFPINTASSLQTAYSLNALIIFRRRVFSWLVIVADCISTANMKLLACNLCRDSEVDERVAQPWRQSNERGFAKRWRDSRLLYSMREKIQYLTTDHTVMERGFCIIRHLCTLIQLWICCWSTELPSTISVDVLVSHAAHKTNHTGVV